LLGFHILGLYIHNDIFVAFGQSQKQILIEPAVIQDTTPQQFLGPGDVLAAHSVAVGLHVTALVSLKGSLDSRGSKLVPDKIMLGFGLACDGPNRGGTCDISAWDSFYLASFWVLNTDAWFLFLFHWKHLVLWQNTSSFESSTYLMGWFRDYLWFNSTPVIRGYNAAGANDNSVWAILFLGAHLVWATGFMFLISWPSLLARTHRYHSVSTPTNTIPFDSLGWWLLYTISFINCASKMCGLGSLWFWIHFNIRSLCNWCNSLANILFTSLGLGLRLVLQISIRNLLLGWKFICLCRSDFKFKGIVKHFSEIVIDLWDFSSSFSTMVTILELFVIC
jgi:hypothetical protein